LITEIYKRRAKIQTVKINVFNRLLKKKTKKNKKGGLPNRITLKLGVLIEAKKKIKMHMFMYKTYMINKY